MKEAEIEMKLYYKILLTCKNELTNYSVYSFSWHIKLKLKTKLLHFYISSFSSNLIDRFVYMLVHARSPTPALTLIPILSTLNISLYVTQTLFMSNSSIFFGRNLKLLLCFN